MMKLALVLSILTTLAQADFSENVPTLNCSGIDTQINGVIRRIQVTTNVENKTLDVAFFSLHAFGPKPYEKVAYPITRVIPMFPIYSISAKRDLSMVDGGKTLVTIAIHNEAIGGDALPSTLTIESIGRLGSTKSTYTGIQCILGN